MTWIPGQPPDGLDPEGQSRLATSLGRFMRRLHRLDTSGLGVEPQRWGYRVGEPVTEAIDGWADTAAENLRGLFDPPQVKKAWRRLRQGPPASKPPCWIHTDLSTENLLATSSGDLAGVLDVGTTDRQFRR